MLVRVLVIAGIVAAAATQVPSLLEQQATTANSEASAPFMLATASQAQPKPLIPSAHGTAVLQAGVGGHYQGDFKINGRAVHGMIDTGATLVSLNESTARGLGISSANLDYRYTTQTANGAAKFALVKLDRLEIGSVKVSDVDAAVMKDEALNSTLIGMSFLKKLRAFGVQDGSLHLTE